MRPLFAKLVALALLLPNAGQAAEAKTNSAANALTAYADCMTDAVIRLDDGHSDAASVGEAALQVCDYEAEMAKLEMGQSMPALKDRRALKADLDVSWRRIATETVLELRHRVRAAHQHR